MIKAAFALLGAFLLLYGSLTLYDWNVPLYSRPLQGERIQHDLATEEPSGVVSMLSAGVSDAEKSRLALSAQRFPDIRSCLLNEESREQTPDIRLVDWKKMQTNLDAELCVARIASLLGNNDQLISWFAFHEFTPKKIGSSEGKEFISFSRPIGISRGPIFPATGLRQWWLRGIAHNQNILLGWLDDETLASVAVEITIL